MFFVSGVVVLAHKSYRLQCTGDREHLTEEDGSAVSEPIRQATTVFLGTPRPPRLTPATGSINMNHVASPTR